jgi:hypothetical protein
MSFFMCYWGLPNVYLNSSALLHTQSGLVHVNGEKLDPSKVDDTTLAKLAAGIALPFN